MGLGHLPQFDQNLYGFSKVKVNSKASRQLDMASSHQHPFWQRYMSLDPSS
jgi:hypothetical protein